MGKLGKTERHGEIIQRMLNKYDHDHNIDTAEEFQQAIRRLLSGQKCTF